MTEYLVTTVDKFIFKVATDCFYTVNGLWVKAEGNHIRIGMSDYLQQRSGDVAFVNVKPEGTQLQAGDEAAEIETIKVNVSLGSPVTGKVIEVNPEMEEAPEAINQDPYGAGWLMQIEAVDWEADRARLQDPQTYFAQMKVEAEAEAKKL